MTPNRFSAIARLIRMRGGRSQEAARLVLVDGLRPIEAARKTGLSAQAVCNAVTRVRRAEVFFKSLFVTATTDAARISGMPRSAHIMSA
jgi:hypothetical protein